MKWIRPLRKPRCRAWFFAVGVPALIFEVQGWWKTWAALYAIWILGAIFGPKMILWKHKRRRNVEPHIHSH